MTDLEILRAYERGDFTEFGIKPLLLKLGFTEEEIKRDGTDSIVQDAIYDVTQK